MGVAEEAMFSVALQGAEEEIHHWNARVFIRIIILIFQTYMGNRIITVLMLFSFSLLMNSCTEDLTNLPCDNNGTICFTNKTDSAVQINIVETHNQFTLPMDNIKCVTMEGKKLYTINLLGRKIYKDTTIHLLVCDEKDFIVKK